MALTISPNLHHVLRLYPESMIKQAKDNPEKAEERWEFLLSEEWMVE